MRVVIQRVSQASIVIDGDQGGSMDDGLVILFGVEKEDSTDHLEWLANKCLELRVFEDEDGKMNQSVKHIHGKVMIVSQFTLFGNMKKGNRPSFNRSALPETAIPLYEDFIRIFKKELGEDRVVTGSFGADMKISLTNDGPVTIIIDSNDRKF